MTGPALAEQPLLAADWRAIGTVIRLMVTDEAGLPDGRAFQERELAALDAACSRFRPDFELALLGASGGRPARVSPLLAKLVAAASHAPAGAQNPASRRPGKARVVITSNSSTATTSQPDTVISAARASSSRSRHRACRARTG